MNQKAGETIPLLTNFLVFAKLDSDSGSRLTIDEGLATGKSTEGHI